jgi:hypothetical protein
VAHGHARLHIGCEPLGEMFGLAVPNLRDIAIDLPLGLSHRRGRVGIQRLGDDMLRRRVWKEISGRNPTLVPLHLALPPRRLMRILNSVVLPSPALVPAFYPKIPDCGAVRA